MISPRNDIVHPRENPTGIATFVGLEHIEPNTGRRIGAAPIDLGLMTGRKARFLPGDIVYGYLRPYLNKVWIAEFAGYCSVDQYVFVVVAGVADTDYVAWYLRSPAYLEAAPIDETPGQLPRIRIDEVLSTPIPLPPLDEQRRIAAHLTIATGESRTALDAVEARHADLDVLRRSTITAAFRAASRAVAVSLASIGRLTDGDWILTADYAPGGVRLLQVGDVGRGRLSIKSNRHITETRATELNCTLLAPGDVLISRMPEPLGRACVLPDLGYPCITAVDITIMRIDPTKADLDYLTGYLDSPDWYAAVAAKSSGATRPRISRRNLELLPVPLPSLAEQRQIATRLRGQLDEVDRAKAALQAQRAAIDMLPAALLREVFGPVHSLGGSA